MTEEIRLSKSNYITFRNCPRRYKYEAIDGISFPPTPAMLTGTYFHEFAKVFYEKISIENGNLIIPEFEIEDSACKNYIKNFIDTEKRRWAILKKKTKNPKKYFIPVLIEKKYENFEQGLVGIVDRVDLNTDDEYIVFELKSGEQPPENLFREELTFYKKLLDSLGVLDKKIKYIGGYSAKKNEVFFEEAKKEDMIRLNANLDLMRNSIKHNLFPKKIGYHCMFCPHAERCKNE